MNFEKKHSMAVDPNHKIISITDMCNGGKPTPLLEEQSCSPSICYGEPSEMFHLQKKIENSSSLFGPAFQHPALARSSPSHTAKITNKNEGTDPQINKTKGPEKK